MFMLISLLASLSLKMPRKHSVKISKSAPSSSGDTGQLTKQVMELVCKRLDGMEWKELAFQLNISEQM